MESSQNIHGIAAKANSAGLTSDCLEEAAVNLCKLRGTSPENRSDLDAAIDEIVKFRQVEQAINSTFL